MYRQRDSDKSFFDVGNEALDYEQAKCFLNQPPDVVHSVPPVRPPPGTALFFRGDSYDARFDFARDQYRFIQKKQYAHKTTGICRRVYKIKDPEGTLKESLDGFQRHAFSLISEEKDKTKAPLFFVHYIGDSSLHSDTPHGNAKTKTGIFLSATKKTRQDSKKEVRTKSAEKQTESSTEPNQARMSFESTRILCQLKNTRYATRKQRNSSSAAELALQLKDYMRQQQEMPSNNLHSSRSANFTETEKQIFLKILQKYQTIVECKKSDNKSIQMKSDAWHKVTSQYNASPMTLDRTLAQLKNLWKNMRASKKKWTSSLDEDDEMHLTSDEPVTDESEGPSTAIIIQEVEPLYNPFDSDAVLHEEEVIETAESPEPNPITLAPEESDELTKMVMDLHGENEASRKRKASTPDSTQNEDAPSPPRIIRMANGHGGPRLTGGAGPITSPHTPPQSRTSSNKITLELDQNDPDMLFLLSLAPMVRKLDSQRSSQFKIQVLQWLHDAEFGY